MNILFVSTWFPYPIDNGARIRVYNLMRALSEKHKVYLVSLLQDESRPEDAHKLSDVCEVVSLHKNRWMRPSGLKVVLGAFSNRPRHIVSSYDPGIRSAIEQAIHTTNADVLIASEFIAMDYVPPDVAVPVVFEELEVGWLHGQLAHLGPAGKLRWRVRFDKWRGFIRSLLSRCNLFTCVSENELNLINRCYCPLCPGAIIPNGVDVDRYPQSDRRPEPGFLLYNGSPTYQANFEAVLYFTKEIHPILKERYPDAILRVTGRTEGADVDEIKDCPGVEFTGYVEDMKTILNRSQICVIPLRQGGGSRLKILEAMAAGVPVVSTSVGAEGLDVVDGENILLADAPRDFAYAVEHLTRDPSFAAELASNARRMVEQRYSWSSIGGAFSRLVESTVEQS